MDSVVITLQLPQFQRTIDLELSSEIPLAKLLPVLVRVHGLPVRDNAGNAIHYQLSLLRLGQPLVLREQSSLAHAGVVTGDILVLTGGGLGVIEMASVPSHSALLQCPSGKVIALENFGKPELLVGRFDAITGRYPDIELSDEPGGHTVSRAHALLRKHGETWYVVPLAEQNNTQLQGMVLAVRQSYPLQEGSDLLLGTVHLIFHAVS